MKEINVLSFGAGVQSSALLFAFLNGLIKEKLDLIIFADTQTEPENVYVWMKKLKDLVGDQIPFKIVTAGNLGKDFFNLNKTADLPLFFKTESGNQGLINRQCTFRYKIEVINREIRNHLGYKPRQRVKHKVNMFIGISVDEMGRMKDSRVKWIKNRYPLIEDLWWTRGKCIDYVESLNHGKASRSACWMCPYRNDHEWQLMKENDPYSWKLAIDFDDKIRINSRFKKGIPFIHRSLKPLKEVEFKKDDSQLDFTLHPLQDECEGMCGV